MTARRDRRSGRAAAIWHVLVGPPLRARDVSREQITPVPAFITVFVTIHHYYDATRRALGLGEIPGKPEGRPAAVVVPVTGVSRLPECGISQALSISRHVLAVTVVHVGARHCAASAAAIGLPWWPLDCCR